MSTTHILLIDCTDEKGLVHRITGVLFGSGLNIISNHEFVDQNSHFFMRSEFTGEVNEDKLIAVFFLNAAEIVSSQGFHTA